MNARPTPFPHAVSPALSLRARPALMMAKAAPASQAEGLSALIVAIAERRDRDAFATLFSHFAPRVKSYIIRRGGGAEIAEEIAQETLLAVWRKAAWFDPSRAAASTWIFTIARNLMIDGLRRQTRAPLENDLSAFETPPAPPDEAVSALQDGRRIGRAIEMLPLSQAEVIRLAFFSDKPHSEIAVALGLPLGTVKSRLRLALARLRDALETAS
jgi:RNA polymerase sigma-70 factor (ECF subfamily)